jgi:hypothetical protein
MRDNYIAQNGPMHGPVAKPKKEQSNQASYAAGGDMIGVIAGTVNAGANLHQFAGAIVQRFG